MGGEIEVGSRIQFKGNIGTIRYIGKLKEQDENGNKEEEWIGIEWDEVTRGKHSGTYNGKHIFTTTVPNSGTFIKATSKHMNTGISLYEAACKRYNDAIDHSHRTCNVTVGGASFDIADEGDSKNIKRIDDINVLDVSGMCVSHVDRQMKENENLKGLKFLSVTRCLFINVKQVLDILVCFPLLKVLDASRNVFHCDADDGCADVVENSHQLDELILNSCSINWNGVFKICSHISSLHVVRLHNCNLNGFDIDNSLIQKHWHGLTLMDVDRNHLSWNDIEQLTTLANLKDLYISRNDLPDHTGFSSSSFKSLQTLSLSNNRINGWKLITSLNKVSTLKHIRISGNAIITKSNSKESIMKIISRISSINQINGSFISADERLQAERRYVRDEIRPCIKSIGIQQTQVIHPRCNELLELLGDVINMTDDNDDMITKIGDSEIVSVRFKCDERIKSARKHATRNLSVGISKERLYVVVKNVLRVDVETRTHMNSLGLKVTMTSRTSDGEGTSNDRVVIMEDGMMLGNVIGSKVGFESIVVEVA